MKSKLLLLFAACAATCEAREVFFLSDGHLTAFDGKAQRSVARGEAAVPAKGPFHHLFDWKGAPGAQRFALSKGWDQRYLPDSDAPSGHALWLREADGSERLIHPSAYRARFSPDGQKLAYTTSDCELRVEDSQGRRLREVRGAYNPAWHPHGHAIAFEKVPTGRPAHLPETLHLATLDVASGEIKVLTDGQFDDVRPEFHPSGRWILFVSGGRTGLASFWKIAVAGGPPEQVTNVGLERVDERFVPTPYQTTAWLADGRWFLYDFKSGDVRQVWGLEFDSEGKLLRAVKLADGLKPQPLGNGRTFAYVKWGGSREHPAVGRLP